MGHLQTQESVRADQDKFFAMVAKDPLPDIVKPRSSEMEDAASVRVNLQSQLPGLKSGKVMQVFAPLAAAAQGLCSYSSTCRTVNTPAARQAIEDKLIAASDKAWAKMKAKIAEYFNAAKKAAAGTMAAMVDTAKEGWEMTAEAATDLAEASVGLAEMIKESKEVLSAEEEAAKAAEEAEKAAEAVSKQVGDKVAEDMGKGPFAAMGYVLTLVEPVMQIFMPSDPTPPICSRAFAVKVSEDFFGTCQEGRERQLGLCYTPCDKVPEIIEYTKKNPGSVFTGNGPICWKKRATWHSMPHGIGRGVGLIGPACPAGKVRHGLWGCFSTDQLCPNGKVPWGRWCTADYNECNPKKGASDLYNYKCGLYCTSSKKECVKFIFSTVLAAVTVVVKVAAIAASMGASMGVDAGAAAIKAAALWGLKMVWTQALLGIYGAAATGGAAPTDLTAYMGASFPGAKDEKIESSAKALCFSCLHKAHNVAGQKFANQAAEDAVINPLKTACDSVAASVLAQPPTGQISTFFADLAKPDTQKYPWLATKGTAKCAKLLKVLNDMAFSPAAQAKDLVWSLVTSVDPTGIASLAGKFVRPMCPNSLAGWDATKPEGKAQWERMESFNANWDFMNFF